MLNAKLSLNIGAGNRTEGDINVDIRPLQNIDVVCDALHLPFRESVFDHVLLRDVIEHFRYDNIINLFREVKGVLVMDGKVEIWTPNFQSLGFLKAWLFGGIENRNSPMLYAPLTGLQDYEENVHLSQWSIKLLKKYVSSQGFKVVYAKGEGEYRGKLLPLKLFTKLFPSRGGVIHLIAIKEYSIP
jgi:predicted SAM-dependent methyltransferase